MRRLGAQRNGLGLGLVQQSRKGLIVLLGLGLIAMGCASAPPPGIQDTLSSPPPGEALVVFLRPSAFSGAARSLVAFDITEGTEILGIFKNGTKTTVSFPPGARIFMGTSGGERTMMKADLEAGKIYYVRVSWRNLTVLSPVKHATVIREWWSSTQLMNVGEHEKNWRMENLSSIESHKKKALKGWDALDERLRSRYTLRREDGVDEPI